MYGVIYSIELRGKPFLFLLFYTSILIVVLAVSDFRIQRRFQVERFDKYSRMGGQWSWKRPSYERDVVSLVKAERKMEESIASALTEVEAVEAGLRYTRTRFRKKKQKRLIPHP